MSPDAIISWAESLVHNPAALALMLALATLITEDGTLIAGSLLVGSDMAGPTLVISAVALGITMGDIGLYGLGALAQKSRFLRRKLPIKKATSLKKWLRGNQTPVLFFSRFLPGTRLPTYLTFGFFRLPLAHFAAVMATASAIWVTGMVLFVSEIQKAFSAFGTWPAVIAGVAIAVAAIMLVHKLVRQSRYGEAATESAEADIEHNDTTPLDGPENARQS